MARKNSSTQVVKQEVYAMIEYERSKFHNDEGEIVISFMVRGDTHDTIDQFFNISDYTYAEASARRLCLHDLKVRGYVEPDRKFIGADKPRMISTYYARPQYRDVYKVELEAAEMMAHTLRTIKNRTEKYANEWGYAQTFEQGVLYILRAVGVKQIVNENDQHAREMSGNRYHVQPVVNVANVIYNLINPPTRVKVLAEAEPIVPEVITSESN